MPLGKEHSCIIDGISIFGFRVKFWQSPCQLLMIATVKEATWSPIYFPGLPDSPQHTTKNRHHEAKVRHLMLDSIDMQCSTRLHFISEKHIILSSCSVEQIHHSRGRWSPVLLIHQVNHMETNSGEMNKLLAQGTMPLKHTDLLDNHSYKHSR